MLIGEGFFLGRWTTSAEHLPRIVHVDSVQVIVNSQIESYATHHAVGVAVVRELAIPVALHQVCRRILTLGAHRDQLVEQLTGVLESSEYT